MNPSVKFGDIFLCDFPFTDGKGSKLRPALALFDLEQDAVIARITSVPHYEKIDLLLEDWANSGLLKPSYLRLGRLVTAEKSVLYKRLGQTSPNETTKIAHLWNKYFHITT